MLEGRGEEAAAVCEVDVRWTLGGCEAYLVPAGRVIVTARLNAVRGGVCNVDRYLGRLLPPRQEHHVVVGVGHCLWAIAPAYWLQSVDVPKIKWQGKR
jgi:hypothetical protein